MSLEWVFKKSLGITNTWRKVFDHEIKFDLDFEKKNLLASHLKLVVIPNADTNPSLNNLNAYNRYDVYNFKIKEMLKTNQTLVCFVVENAS